MAASKSNREAIEVAARPLREWLREEHDEIAAAQRALRQAEKAHNRAVELAQRQLRAARTSEPLASYGHDVILYAARLSTARANHELTPEVRAWIEDTGRRPLSPSPADPQDRGCDVAPGGGVSPP